MTAARIIAPNGGKLRRGTLGERKLPAGSSNTGLPGLLAPAAKPTPGAALRQILTTPAAAITSSIPVGRAVAPPPPRTLVPPKPKPAPSPEPAYAAPAPRPALASSSSSGGASPFLAAYGPPVASSGPSAGDDLPAGASFSLVSGDVPDGVVYLIVGGLLAAGAYAIWRRSQKGRR